MTALGISHFTEDLIFEPAHRLAGLIRQGQISAVELLEAHLTQMDRHNPALNAIVILDEDGACRRAWEADAALASGQCWGPLHGVPLTLKDHLDTAGMRSTMGGYPPFIDRVPEQDSTVAARLKNAGAILLGKSNAVFFPFGTFGPSKNPWDLERTPGISSSGAAAALAAGLTPLDIGTDTSGSVLLPAHNCGIFGLRPTATRVSLAGITSPWPAQPIRILTVFGPMARSVSDLALVMKLIAGPDGRDCEVPPVPWRNVRPPAVSDLRIAWTPAFPDARITGEIRGAIKTLASKLEEQGAKTERCLPRVDFARQVEVSRSLFLSLMLNIVCQPTDTVSFAEDRPSLGEYLRLLEERNQLISAWERFFTDWDALLCPGCGVTAQLHDHETPGIASPAFDQEDVFLPLRLAAATGHPAVVIPLTLDAIGLPIGAQLIGPRWRDEHLLAIAGPIAGIAGGFRRPPGY